MAQFNLAIVINLHISNLMPSKTYMKKIERIKLLAKGLYNIYTQYGLKQLLKKCGKVIWEAILKADLSQARRTLAALASRHANALSYTDWVTIYEKLDVATLATQTKESRLMKRRPLFSIVVPTYNTPNQILVNFIESVLSQTYEEWELCIADDASTTAHVRETLNRYAEKDARIKVIYRDSNGHIAEATNSALEMVTGEFVCLMDHDDTIAPNALYEFAVKLNENNELDFIYSDEDKISFDGTLRFDPHIKPDWSPEYLECCMYTAHFACYRAGIVRQ